MRWKGFLDGKNGRKHDEHLEQIKNKVGEKYARCVEDDFELGGENVMPPTSLCLSFACFLK